MSLRLKIPLEAREKESVIMNNFSLVLFFIFFAFFLIFEIWFLSFFLLLLLLFCFFLTSEGWSSHMKELLVDGDQTQINVEELQPVTEYSFRLLAENAVGRSLPSIPLTLVTESEGMYIYIRLGNDFCSRWPNPVFNAQFFIFVAGMIFSVCFLAINRKGMFYCFPGGCKKKRVCRRKSLFFPSFSLFNEIGFGWKFLFVCIMFSFYYYSWNSSFYNNFNNAKILIAFSFFLKF